MGVLKSVGDFLFGKSPDIFDNSGNIVHKLSKRTWDAWNNRIKMDPDYNWRNHRGTRAGNQGKQPSQKIMDNSSKK